ncbi:MULTISPECIES: ImcF-related family protein [unclassified Pseudomonas]|uniref:ImcF-related family protein n=1 Tax=unclassified Pseudomonas TaxID=196821 RepID=UPI00129E1BD3|nr:MULTISPECIES: ImcF-related family protein [unclassified Pseudomonas]MDH4653356.1 type VI secretion protein VasK [Pseudomonas sp. BN606]MRK20687.1 type VI secretion protein VasK [Pseudomonas sp. JG-B]
MRSRRAMWLGVLVGLVLLIGVILSVLLWWQPMLLGVRSGSEVQAVWRLAAVGMTVMVLVMVSGYALMGRRVGGSTYREQEGDDVAAPVQAAGGDVPASPAASVTIEAIKAHLCDTIGFFWRRKVRPVLVVGERDQIEAIAPTLSEQRWLEGEGVLLLWGGSTQGEPDAAQLEQWRKLCTRRPLDGIVWALTPEQSADPAHIGHGVTHLQKVTHLLRWQAPVHLWQVYASDWSQQERPSEAVGCRLSPHVNAAQLESSLQRLAQPLREQGLVHMQDNPCHDFLLRLARDLHSEGSARWQHALGPLLRARGVILGGLWFSLSLRRLGGGMKNTWQVDPAWWGVLSDNSLGGQPQGLTLPRVGSALLLGLAALWGSGMLLSYASNRAQIGEVQAALATLEQPRDVDSPLRAFNELVHQMDRLDFHAQHGVPWHQRFGLSQNEALLDTLWPRYVAANNRLIRDPAAANLESSLRSLLDLPPGSPERAARASETYDSLKAYLMMARPDKTDAPFLAQTLVAAETHRAGVASGVWQAVAPNLWRFYAEHLSAHPEWRVDLDPALVAQARQVLLGQLGQRNGETALYEAVLEAAANHYPPLGLRQMVSDTNTSMLFSTEAEVPGVFTRQAWEGQVRKAIDDIAEARREEIDWVLSDDQNDIAADMTAEVLRERLAARYFQDYGSAWLEVLNSLQWHQAASLADVIDQLTLMSDIRQSPLIALMNTLAYQGQAGAHGQALSDSLIKSAQKLMGQNQAPVIDQQHQGLQGPLDDSFGPLLSLLGKGAEATGNDGSLSLHAFLARVTRVRLKLQQVSNAPDPQAMTQALAQTVFQGKSVDLADAQSYGSLIAASLGAEWGHFGNALFVQPLEQAWRRVLQPSTAGLNDQWQRAIVEPWSRAFAGRYPFAATASDASLPMLGQMIRSDSGRIHQFLQQQLEGVLRKQGNHWVPDVAHSQGLRFNPEFLKAVNQLADLADVLYTDGGMGLAFELRAKPVRDVVQTTLTLDGERLDYFNQRESWQRFAWPGASDHPGASLSWTSVKTGERLYGDYSGTWGVIRLLEHARVTALDDSETRYHMVLEAPDGLKLTWHLRTELGAGPLALIQLRGFRMPTQIFLDEDARPLPYAQNGSFR